MVVEAPEPEAKVRKVELTVEVRAVSGSCLSILEMFASNTIADVKARLEGIAGRYDLASSRGSQVIVDSTELSQLIEPGPAQPIVLCLIWRRVGFAYSASNIDGSLTLWDLARREVVHRLQCSLCQPQCPICLFTDWEQQRVLCCLEDGTLYLWGRTSETDEMLHLLRVMQDKNAGDRPGVSSKEAVAVDWSQGKVLLGTMAGRLLLWDLHSGKILKVFRGHRSCIDVVRVCWQRSQALSACRDRVIRFWKLETGECSLLRGHTSSVCCLLVNWDLRRAMSAGLMDGLRLWTLESRQSVEVSRLQLGEMGRIFCCDIDWKSEKAITGSGLGILTLWDLNLLKMIWRHDSHGHDVYAVSFEPESLRCLSAGEFSVCIWDHLGALQCRIEGAFGQASLVLEWKRLWLLCASDAVYLYDVPDKDNKPEAGFEAKMVCQLKDERNTQTESLSCLAVEWPEAVYL